MKHTISYTDLVAILSDAIDYNKDLLNNIKLSENFRYYREHIEYLRDLKYKLYESKAKFFTIKDDNPF